MININSLLCKMSGFLPAWRVTPKRFERNKMLTRSTEDNKDITCLEGSIAVLNNVNETETKPLGLKANQSFDKIDSFLINDFNHNLREKENSNPHKQSSKDPFLLPMIIEIGNPNWKSKMPPSHHKEYYRSDRIVACYGSIEDVKSLNDDEDVICVEAADIG
jgi:hypothetical protein